MATLHQIDIADEGWGKSDCFRAVCRVVAERTGRKEIRLRQLLGRHPLSLGIRSHEELAEAGKRHGGLAMRLREHLREREACGALVRCDADEGDICILGDVLLGCRADDERIYFAEPWGLGCWEGRQPRYWWKFDSRDPEYNPDVDVCAYVEIDDGASAGLDADDADGTAADGLADDATDDEATDVGGGDGTDDEATDGDKADATDDDEAAADDTDGDAGGERRRWWQL